MQTAFRESEKRVLAARLKRSRSRRLLTPREMAALVGISWPTLMAMENAKGGMSLGVLRKLRAFDPGLLKGVVDDDALQIPGKPKNNYRMPAEEPGGMEGSF